MGNCCSGDHSKPEDPSHPPPPEPPLGEEHEYAPDDHPRPSNTSDAMASTTTATNTPFLGTPDTMAIKAEMEKNFLHQKTLAGDHHQATTSSTSSPSKEEGKKPFLFDPKLVSLLEFFRHLYVRRKEVFRRVISVHGEELVEVLKKIGQVEESIERPRIQLIQRSNSVGTAQDLKHDRFKVKTFNPDEKPPLGGQGGGSK